MNNDSLPPDLRDLAEDETIRADYERIWSLLQRRSDTERSDAQSSSGPSSGPSAEAFDVDAAWNELADDLDLDASPSAESPSRAEPAESGARDRASDRHPRPSAARDQSEARPAWLRPVMGTAVVLLLVVGAAVWWSQPVTVSTAAGGQASVTLPDGSTVRLNGATTLSYPRGFDRLPGIGADVRSVTLQGEAYFQVKPGSRRFRVRTENATAEVLGTTFNVHARRHGDTPSTEIVLSSGRLRVFGAPASASRSESGNAEPREASTEVSPASVLLQEAGARTEVTGVDGAPTAPKVIDLKYADAWRTGGFAVRNAPVSVILEELETQFGTSLRLGTSVRPTDTLTLHYTRSVELEEVLRDVCLLQGLTYRKDAQGYVLIPAESSAERSEPSGS